MKRKKNLIKTMLFVTLALLLCSNVYATDLSEFEGKRIGVQSATTQEQLASQLFGKSSISYFNSLPDAVVALENNKIDAFFGDDLPLLYAASNTNDLTVIGTGGDGILTSAIFAKNEWGNKLLTQFNEFLTEYRSQGKLDTLFHKWFEGSEKDRVMDTSLLPDINGTLTIACEAGYPPFEYIKNGEIVGFEVELVRDFCKTYGYSPTFLSASFDSLIIGVSTGKFDLSASSFTITEERKQSVNFAESYATTHNALLVKSNAGWTGTTNNKENEVKKTGIAESVSNGIKRTFIEEKRWKLFASGIRVTFEITVLSVVFGTIAGFGLYLICRNGNRIANLIVKASKWFITGMPLVVFLMVLFYIVFAKSGISGTRVSIIGFSIIFAFTMFDLLKSGESAVDIGQKEAAYSLGYTDFDAFWRIILPQAAKHFMPFYLSEVIALNKSTAIVGYITVLDVTKIGDIVRGRTYDAVFPLLAVVIAYFLLSAVCKILINQINRKVNTKSRPDSAIMKGVRIR